MTILLLLLSVTPCQHAIGGVLPLAMMIMSDQRCCLLRRADETILPIIKTVSLERNFLFSPPVNCGILAVH